MAEQVFVAKTYDFIVDYFTEERMRDRYKWLYGLLEKFISAEKLEDKVHISPKVLNHVIIDYYVDIYRLKEFQGIEMVHDSKIYAYLSFWLLRHKVLQLSETDSEDIVFINEKFVQEFLRSYLFKDPDNVPISVIKKEEIDNFLETLVYYFQYRDFSAKSIEMIILGFQAGRGYQYSVDFER